MLFHKRNCEHCQAEYDEMLDYCPYCFSRNEGQNDVHQKSKITFIPVSRELLLFGLGIFGFIIFSFIFSLIFSGTYKEDEIKGGMLINVASYVLFFIAAITLVFPFWRSFRDRFIDWKSYIFGIAGFAILLGGSILINMIMQIIYPAVGTGGNQSSISQIAQRFPVVAILVFGMVGPICEELSYRIGLFSLFRRVSVWLAYVGTALIFGLIHFDFTSPDLLTELALLPTYIWAGVSLGLIYHFWGIGASTTAHILNNLLSLFLIIAGIQQ